MNIQETGSPADVSRILEQRIRSKIERNCPVLLLVSGNSSASIAASACTALADAFSRRAEQLKLLLTITLADERFGATGHQDSNWSILMEHGFPATACTCVPVLQGNDESKSAFEYTVSRYNTFLAEAVRRSRNGDLYVIAVLGIGEDGHTAGILPESPASVIDPHSTIYATGYRSALFKRITITPAFFPFIDFALVRLPGSESGTVLASLQIDMSAGEQPAQLLKTAKESMVCIDRTAARAVS
jgi:6-phosphogluconolactonase/glucosamine-6-phosphate isomerase/deaminase